MHTHTLTSTERLVILALRLASPQTFDDLMRSTGTGSPTTMRTAIRVLSLREMIRKDGKSIHLADGGAL